MPHQLMIRLRLPLLLLAAAFALATSAGPAFAGEDDTPPPPPPAQPAPIPVVPPAATPVPPAPTPVPPVTPPVQPKPKPKPKAKSKPKVVHNTRKEVQNTSNTSTPVQPTPVVVRRVQAVQATATPQGGIQAGAGGTAPQGATHSSLPLGVAALVLTLLALGGASRLARLRSHR
jgi:outer membrane biosynthesis protein TonB